MHADHVLNIPLRARLVSEPEAQRLLERQQQVREEYVPKAGGWVDQEQGEESEK